jgi:hypothetical protein
MNGKTPTTIERPTSGRSRALSAKLARSERTTPHSPLSVRDDRFGLDHEDVPNQAEAAATRKPRIYRHVDLTLKDARLPAPRRPTRARWQPTADQLLAFLEGR